MKCNKEFLQNFLRRNILSTLVSTHNSPHIPISEFANHNNQEIHSPSCIPSLRSVSSTKKVQVLLMCFDNFGSLHLKKSSLEYMEKPIQYLAWCQDEQLLKHLNVN